MTKYKIKTIISIVMALTVVLSCLSITGFSYDDKADNKLNYEKYQMSDLPDVIYETLFSSESIPVEIINYDTDDLYSISTLNDDGSTGLYIFETPIKYLEDDMVKIKKNIVKESRKNSYEYEISDNEIKTFFPYQIEKGINVEYNGAEIRFSPEKTNATASYIDNSVQYESDNISYNYSAVLGGLKEDIIISEYKEELELNFDLIMDGIVPTTDSGESIPLIDKRTSELSMVIGQVVIIDSSGKEPSFNNSISLENKGSNQYSLTLELDKEYLTADDTIYPIIVDPTITIGSSNMYDAPVYSGKPSSNFYTNEYNMVGYHDSSYGEAETFVKLNSISAYKYINPEKITSVNYHVYEGSGKTSSATIKAYDTDTTWIDSTITYNNKPNTYSSAISSITINNSTWYNFNIKPLFKNWLKYELGEDGGFSPNFGFCLKASSTGQSSRHFCSANNTVYPPSIVVVYNEDTTITNGTYYIKSKYSNKYLSSSDNDYNNFNVTQEDYCGNKNQHWTVENIGNGYYIIKAQGFNITRALDIESNPTNNGSNVDVYSSSTSGDYIIFKIVSNNDGSYRITSKWSNNQKVLDVCGPSTAAGANIQIWEYVGANQQKWIFEEVNTKNFGMINTLDSLAYQYHLNNTSSAPPFVLSLQYIRSNYYSNNHWPEVAGNVDGSFVNYVNANGNVSCLSSSRQYLYFSNHRIDFTHMCATLNALLFTSTSFQAIIVGDDVVNDLSGWAGDLQTLVIDALVETNYNDNYTVMYNKCCELLGDDSFQFAEDDFYADMDAVYINDLISDITNQFLGNTLLMYYNSYASSSIIHFINNRTDTQMHNDFYFYTRNYYSPMGIEIYKWPIYDNALVTVTQNQANAAADAFINYLYSQE